MTPSLLMAAALNKRPLKEGKEFKLLPKHQFWKDPSLGAENNSFLLLQIIFLFAEQSAPCPGTSVRTECSEHNCEGPLRRARWGAAQVHAIIRTPPPLQDLYHTKTTLLFGVSFSLQKNFNCFLRDNIYELEKFQIPHPALSIKEKCLYFSSTNSINLALQIKL